MSDFYDELKSHTGRHYRAPFLDLVRVFSIHRDRAAIRLKRAVRPLFAGYVDGVFRSHWRDNMRISGVLLIVCLVVAPVATAGNLTEKNQQKTDKVIAKLVEAYGGAATLDQIDSLTVVHSNEFVAVGQSRKPEPPWDTSVGNGTTAIDLDDQRLVVINKGSGNGFEFHNATLINAADSFELDYRAGLARPIEAPDFAGSAGPFIRVTPVLLVQALREHARTAHYLGVTDLEERPHHVVRFAMASGPAISLYVDQETALITHSERIVPGFGLIEYDFADYETIEGIPFNRTFVLHQAGDLSMKRKNIDVTVNSPVAPLLVVDRSLEMTAPLPPDPMSLQTLADGVHLIGGNGTYGLFVEMEDHVIAVGGVGGVDARMAELEAVTDKPVRYGVLTHHHSDHIMAVPAYAAMGATVVAARAHQKAVAETVEADTLNIKTVKKKLDLSDDSRRVVVLDIGPTPHSEHLLVTWLPDEKILFEADHFSMPRSGPVPPAIDSTREFAAALDRLGLDPRYIVSAHSPRPGTMADLRLALETPVASEPVAQR
ncbi:MAG: MBL fold metallo-hydrolase [Pseudomonadota bacterium]